MYYKKVGGYHDENPNSHGADNSLLYRGELRPAAVARQPVGEGFAAAQSCLPRRSRSLGMVDTSASHRRKCYCGCGIRRNQKPVVVILEPGCPVQNGLCDSDVFVADEPCGTHPSKVISMTTASDNTTPQAPDLEYFGTLHIEVATPVE